MNPGGNRHGNLGEVLDTGTMLLGRRTWQLFAATRTGRDDEFPATMNAMPRLVASRSLKFPAYSPGYHR